MGEKKPSALVKQQVVILPKAALQPHERENIGLHGSLYDSRGSLILMEKDSSFVK